MPLLRHRTQVLRRSHRPPLLLQSNTRLNLAARLTASRRDLRSRIAGTCERFLPRLRPARRTMFETRPKSFIFWQAQTQKQHTFMAGSEDMRSQEEAESRDAGPRPETLRDPYEIRPEDCAEPPATLRGA